MITVSKFNSSGFVLVPGDNATWNNKFNDRIMSSCIWRENTGTQPVGSRCSVEVKFRDGSTESIDASNIRWNILKINSDIVKWRPHLPALETKSALEMSARDIENAVYEWNGNGLPPVGVECVFTPDNTAWGFNYTDNFVGCVLHYEGEKFVFMMKHTECRLEQEMLVVSRTDKGVFSKPESPEAKLARERDEAAIEIHDAANKAFFKTLPPDWEWEYADEKTRNMWRAVVDLTGYRKGGNDEEK